MDHPSADYISVAASTKSSFLVVYASVVGAGTHLTRHMRHRKRRHSPRGLLDQGDSVPASLASKMRAALSNMGPEMHVGQPSTYDFVPLSVVESGNALVPLPTPCKTQPQFIRVQRVVAD